MRVLVYLNSLNLDIGIRRSHPPSIDFDEKRSRVMWGCWCRAARLCGYVAVLSPHVSESSLVYMFIILALCVVYFFLLFCIRVCEAMCIIISSGCQFAWTNVFMLLLFRFLTTIYSTRQMRVAITCSHSIHNHHWTRLLMRSYFLPTIFFFISLSISCLNATADKKYWQHNLHNDRCFVRVRGAEGK